MMKAALSQTSLRQVRLSFVSRLPGRVVAVRKLLVEIDAGSISPAALYEAQHHLHQVAGTAATLGFSKLGEVAQNCDEIASSFKAGVNGAGQLSEELFEVLRLMHEAQQP